MRNIGLLIGIFVSQLVSAIEPIYISLGYGCTPAFRLTDSQLRHVSYPFDWIVSTFDSIYNGFKDDFSRFFTDLKLTADRTSTLDFYGFEFHHIWHTKETGLAYSDPLDNIDWQAMLPGLTETFHRRIARVLNACRSEHPVIFIRYDSIDKNSAIRLRDLIKNKYPKLPFILVVVKFAKEFTKPWHI